MQRQQCPNLYLDYIELQDKKILSNAKTLQSYCQSNHENRNMFFVFHIISIIFYQSSRKIIRCYSSFSSILSISFQGDENRPVAIDKQELLSLFYQCLCHKVLRRRGEMMRTKIGAPPIGKSVRSIGKYKKNCSEWDSKDNQNEVI